MTRRAICKTGDVPPNGIKQFEDGFEVLTNIVRNTNDLDKSGWPEHRKVQFFGSSGFSVGKGRGRRSGSRWRS